LTVSLLLLCAARPAGTADLHTTVRNSTPARWAPTRTLWCEPVVASTFAPATSLPRSCSTARLWVPSRGWVSRCYSSKVSGRVSPPGVLWKHWRAGSCDQPHSAALKSGNRTTVGDSKRSPPKVQNGRPTTQMTPPGIPKHLCDERHCAVDLRRVHYGNARLVPHRTSSRADAPEYSRYCRLLILAFQ